MYKSVLSKGGEGVMIKDPISSYEDKRSDYMLKYKPCFDAEAIIIDYKDGNGKYANKLGAFICRPLINYGNYSVIDKNQDMSFVYQVWMMKLEVIILKLIQKAQLLHMNILD